jgi:7-carboxy-7-deazaguanine synthase
MVQNQLTCRSVLYLKAFRMKSDTLLVHSIFRSIQGESSFAGLPCVFIRLAGCNLRCSYCDTPEAFTEGIRMSREDILSRVEKFATPLVELTGGEPLIQQGSRPLLHELCETGKTVLLETNGARSIARIDERVHRIMDIKTPSSTVSHKNRWKNIALLTKRDEVKFVLLDRADYEWTRDVIRRESLWERVAEVLLSPVHGSLDPQQLVSWVLEDSLHVRVQIQLHKYIWAPDTKNV